MRGVKRRMPASWNELHSTTAHAGCGWRRASSLSAVPMLPPATASIPAPRIRCSTSAVTVVLPLVPVMPMTGQSSCS